MTIKINTQYTYMAVRIHNNIKLCLMRVTMYLGKVYKLIDVPLRRRSRNLKSSRKVQF